MKDYKKILEGVIDIISTTEKSDIGFANICTYIGENCPELKESEDERIRKELLQIAKECEDTFYMVMTPNKRKHLIAWLEKQGEKFQYWKPSKEQLKALDYAYNSCSDTERGNYYEGVLETLIDDLHKLSEKQSEQKPIIEMKSPEESLGIDSDTYNKIVDECIYGEQKPTKGAKGNDREIPFSEQEWSEEDEIGLGDALWAIQQAKTIAKDENDMGNVWFAENWLKSLKDRHTWKPSEGQLEALEKECIAHSNYELCRLLEQLKKLKE